MNSPGGINKSGLAGWPKGGKGGPKGDAHWPLATVHSDPLWVRTWFGCVNGAPWGGDYGGALSAVCAQCNYLGVWPY